jgi:hypothetical protein
LTFPNIIGLYKYVTFFNNTAYQIALSGNGIPIFTCPAYKNITVQIPAAIHQMQQANYVAVWSGSTGTPVNQAYLVFSENNLGLNIDLSPGAGTPGGAIDTDLLNILAELVTLAGSTTLAQLLTALGAGGAITTELTRLDTDLLALIAQNNSAYPTGKTPWIGTAYLAANIAGFLSMPAVAGKYGNISQITISFSIAVSTGINIGTSSGISWQINVPIGQTSPIILSFTPPLQATAVNTAITLTCPAAGIGVVVAISANGYYSAA